MKLNIDRIRDILICVEENSNYSHGVEFYNPFSQNVGVPGADNGMPTYNKSLFEKYGKDVLFYHIGYCFDDGLITTDDSILEPYIGVVNLTPRGHDVLSRLRSETTKSILAESDSISNFALKPVTKKLNNLV